MALSKNQKNDVVSEVSDLLGTSKMTVVAKYQGTTVKALQALRREARSNGTKVKVVKNRLVIKALAANERTREADTSDLQGMLLYAFNADDEVAPAQILSTFAKKNPTLEFVGAITGEGKFIGADEVKALANLPSKDQLIAQVVATLLSPVNDVTNALSGNLHALLDGIEAKATAA
ncbi:MAG TPA: 50S ribosomal protein L10 [Candidatus Saccharimonadales bacterium]|nr:50S ribosomal protein L10 [Candidatus Saccharimonadales bacterium]